MSIASIECPHISRHLKIRNFFVAYLKICALTRTRGVLESNVSGGFTLVTRTTQYSVSIVNRTCGHRFIRCFVLKNLDVDTRREGGAPGVEGGGL